MSVDVRTRGSESTAPVEASTFFGDVLPELVDAMGAELVEPLARLSPRPLTVDVDGDVWTLSAAGGRVVVQRGEGPGAAVLRLTPEQLGDLVDDQATPMAWLAGGTLQLDGRLETALDWWLVIRGALDGRAPYAGGGVELLDRDGHDLDLHRAFTADTPTEDLRHFLETAGFLHLAGVFSEDEMAEVSADMDRAAPSYEQGDGRSWWARTQDGTDRLVRMQGFDRESPAVARLVEDRRLRRFESLTGDGHRWGALAENRIEALFKPIGVVEGISDVPWHKDCSLGRHSHQCCSLTVGVSVTGADASSGQLRVVAGSHRALVWPALVRRDLDLPVVDLPTRTGDVTVHLSCTLHMAQPPVERERRVLYTGFRLPPRGDEDRERLRALRRVREAAPVTVSQPPAVP